MLFDHMMFITCGSRLIEKRLAAPLVVQWPHLLSSTKPPLKYWFTTSFRLVRCTSVRASTRETERQGSTTGGQMSTALQPEHMNSVETAVVISSFHAGLASSRSSSSIARTRVMIHWWASCCRGCRNSLAESTWSASR